MTRFSRSSVRPPGRRRGYRRAVAVAVAAIGCLSACSVTHNGGSSGSSGSATATKKVTFSGKTITIITNATAGGSSDVIARLIAAKLPDYLPGKPTVIVKNITGGGGSVEISQVSQTLPADGLTIGEFNSGMAIRYLTKQPGFGNLGSIPIVAGLPQGAVAIYNKNVGTDVKAIVAKGKTLRIGQTSAGGTGAMLSIVASDLLKLPNKQVYGFSGGSAETTSMQRGELDGTVTADLSYESTFAPDVKSGKYVALFQAGIASNNTIEKSPLIAPSIPTVLDLYKQLHNGATPTGDAWKAYQLMATLQASYTTFGLRKGTPANVSQTIQDGFAKMTASADWKSFTKSKLGAAALPGNLATIKKEWSAALGSSADQITLLKRFSGLQN